jgi:Holliday junction DNA helicase RuvA
MIGTIKGKPTIITEKYIIIEVNNIGYKIYVNQDILSKISDKNEIMLFTYLVVKEDALDLYGFRNLEEKEMFELLISVSGVGPKGALGILGVAPLEILKRAIVTKDISYMTQVSGIGKKTAEKIIIELRDKLKDSNITDYGFVLNKDSDVIEALKSLGYSQNEAREMIKNIPEEIEDINQRIKEALKGVNK